MEQDEPKDRRMLQSITFGSEVDRSQPLFYFVPYLTFATGGARVKFLAGVNFYRFNAKNWLFFYRFYAKNWRFSV